MSNSQGQLTTATVVMIDATQKNANITLHLTPGGAIRGKHIVGHVQSIRLAGWANASCGKQNVNVCQAPFLFGATLSALAGATGCNGPSDNGRPAVVRREFGWWSAGWADAVHGAGPSDGRGRGAGRTID
jgi:hypothetical protein